VELERRQVADIKELSDRHVNTIGNNPFESKKR
jgi:hypothetical protein